MGLSEFERLKKIAHSASFPKYSDLSYALRCVTRYNLSEHEMDLIKHIASRSTLSPENNGGAKCGG